jgi:serine/threonine protein kinase
LGGCLVHVLVWLGLSQEKYSELEAQRVVKTLTEAIGYCHTQFVVHRDLKVCVYQGTPCPSVPPCGKY